MASRHLLQEISRAVRKRLWNSIWALFIVEALLITLYFIAEWQLMLQTPYLVYIVGGLILVLMLAVFQKKKLPFRYAVKLSTYDHIMWAVAPFFEIVGIAFFAGIISYVGNPLLNSGIFLGASLVSITEESLKVVMINGLALIMGKLKRGFIRAHRIWIAGTISVALWTLAHIPYMHYGSAFLGMIFVTGMIMFYVTYRKRSVFPAIYIHILWNLFF